MPSVPPAHPAYEILDRLLQNHAKVAEAEVQADIRQLLIKSGLNLDTANLDETRLESPLGDGTRRRIDIEVGQTVIEVKRNLRAGKILEDAVKQLAGYIEQRQRELDVRYLGIITDGREWHLYALLSEFSELEEISSIEMEVAEDYEKLLIWIEEILATTSQVKPTAEEIDVRLGVNSPSYAWSHRQLNSIFASISDHPEVRLKRHLWARLVRTAMGNEFEDDEQLFIDHTLLVLYASVIAHAVVGLNIQKLKENPEQVLTGVSFASAQIYNVVEPDFFDWILKSEAGIAFLRELIRQISRFNWSAVEHDILKVLYESIIERGVRKSLGEYYTPDWLAEKMVTETIEDVLNSRTMDPGCGSGTFVFHVVRHFIRHAEKVGMSNSEILENVQRRVFGMDIHPISVMLAKVTYLLAIGSNRLQGDRGPVTVPVYLGDSVQWVNDASSINEDKLRIEVDSDDLAPSEEQGTLFNVGRVLAFPLATLSDPVAFDDLIKRIAERAQSYTDSTRKKPDIERLLNTHGVTSDADRRTLLETFDILCTLNAEGRNHIWGYFVRNQSRPLWFSLAGHQMDYLMGNPPWVAYRFMTADMQRQFRRFSGTRNLWSGGSVATQQDLVSLFIARSVELYLKPGGRFAFVVPRSVLVKDQYRGFRAGKWATMLPSYDPKQHRTVRVKFDMPWDLDKIRPHLFPVPSAVVHGQRTIIAEELGAQTWVYSGRLPARAVSWNHAKELIEISEGSQSATPDSPLSPYNAKAYNGAMIYPRVLFFIEERDPGVLGGARGVQPYVSFRSAQEKEPWNKIESLEGNIEKAFVRDVALGESIAPYRVLSFRKAILPVLHRKFLGEEEIRQHQYLDEWWSQVSRIWTANKKPTSKLSLADQLNYHNKLSSQLGVSRHRVVYTKSGTRMVAAYISDPDIIIDHKLYWLSLDSSEHALYLLAMLNSQTVQRLVEQYQSRGLFGGRDFDKHVWKLPIRAFSSENPEHVQLSEYARLATETAASCSFDTTANFTKARNIVRQALIKSGLQKEIDSLTQKLIVGS